MKLRSTRNLAPKRCNVLMTLPNLNGGGIERAALNLYQALDHTRFAPKVLVHEKVGKMVSEVSQDVNLQFICQGGPYRRIQLVHLFLETLRQTRSVDVVMACNEGRAGTLALLAAKLLGKPVIAWINFDWIEFQKLLNWRQMLGLQLYRFADCVVAGSEGSARSFAKLVPVHPDKLRVINYGMPTQTILQKASEPLPPDMQALFEKPTVLTVGRLDYQKGHEFLIDAHARLQQWGIDHNLILIGSGELLPQLQQQTVALGVTDSVHFLDYQSNHYQFTRQATVFALSSRFEGNPLVIPEAMICGVPVVSFDCPSGPKESLDHGKYGVLVKPEDPQALAEALAPLLTDPDQRAEMSGRAQMRGKDFDQDDLARQWEELMQELMR